MKKAQIVTIDGGAASGKSSTSKLLSERLNYLHVDTGSHYRSITFALIKGDADPLVEESWSDLLERMELGYSITGKHAKILIDGSLLEEPDIRSPEVNENVSKFASIPAVRQKLLNYQRDHERISAEEGFDGLIMEGRDIGSVVFPEAPYRFYLFADEATRQARRAKDGQVDSIKARDTMDSTRKTAPLKVPDGAMPIDTSHMTLEEVVAKIETIVRG